MADITKAYCSVADIQDITRVTLYSDTPTTVPSKTAVEGFARKRAATVYSWIREILGPAAPGPEGYDVTLDVSTDAGRALDQAAREANAKGAAIDVLETMSLGEEPEASERVERLIEAFDGPGGTDRAGREILSPLQRSVQEAARGMRDRAALSSNHYSSGERTAAPVASTEEQPFTFTEDTLF